MVPSLYTLLFSLSLIPCSLHCLSPYLLLFPSLSLYVHTLYLLLFSRLSLSLLKFTLSSHLLFLAIIWQILYLAVSTHMLRLSVIICTIFWSSNYWPFFRCLAIWTRILILSNISTIFWSSNLRCLPECSAWLLNSQLFSHCTILHSSGLCLCT